MHIDTRRQVDRHARTRIPFLFTKPTLATQSQNLKGAFNTNFYKKLQILSLAFPPIITRFPYIVPSFQAFHFLSLCICPKSPLSLQVGLSASFPCLPS